MEELPAPELPPLPTVGEEKYADAGQQQPWGARSNVQAKHVREFFGTPDEPVELMTASEDTAPADHRRCLRYIALLRFVPAAHTCSSLCILFATALAVSTQLSAHSPFSPSAIVLLFSVLWGLIMGLILFREIVEVNNSVRRLSLSSSVNNYFYLATAKRIIEVSDEKARYVHWPDVRSIAEYRGDLYIFWRSGPKQAGYLYIPRRAFADRSDARRFRDALKALRRPRSIRGASPNTAQVSSSNSGDRTAQ